MMELKDVLRIVVRAVYEQSLTCIEHGLLCLDPPVLTSGMLKRYGIRSDHVILNFWKAVDRIITTHRTVPIYRSRYIDFEIQFQHRIEEVYKLSDLGMYVDPAECMERNCIAVPHAHVLKVYLEGKYGGYLALRLNVVTLIKIVSHYEPKFMLCLHDFSENPLSLDKLVKFAECVYSLFTRHRSMLQNLLDRLPESFEGFLNLSPLLRHALRRILGT